MRSRTFAPGPLRLAKVPVSRADHVLDGDESAPDDARMLVGESIARRVLTDMLASDRTAHLAAVPTWSATHALAS